MTRSKHTPGPWTWEAWGNDPDEHSTLAAPPSSRRGGPSQLFPDLGEQVLHLDEPIENDADAHLIAAAPVMYRLLEELIDIEGPQPGDVEWFNRVKAVMAKARGET